MLKTQYPESPMMLGADKNQMDIRPILNCGLRLKQLVDLPTRNGKILDIIIMNTPQYYNSPIIVPPVPCDDPSTGAPSDHSVPICVPHTDRYNPPTRRYKNVTYRPLPDTCINEFGQWITKETFKGIENDISANDHAKALESLLMGNLDKFCPLKSFRVGPQDKAWITPELKSLSRRKQREWLKNGKSAKYDDLSAKFSTKYEAAAEKYMRTKIEALKTAQPGKAFGVLKSMGAQPGDCTDDQTFTLPTHQSEGLTDQQSAERIADYFAAISNEYQSLDLELLPPRVQAGLRVKSIPPIITELECYEKIKAAKKPQSGVPWDLPNTIIKEFSVELGKPLQKLLNKIVQSSVWPQHWKTEFVTPIGKIPQPESEDDLRPIAITSFFSKVMEQFVVMWLLEIIGDKLDIRQYGGMKGNSISHYLIELINFILYNQDNQEPTAVLACLIDFSKAFNRQDHNILITKLSDMGVPAWLLKLVIAFLKNRSMVVRYKGKVSNPKLLPGGGPQGTLLGLLLFLVLVNEVGYEGQCNNNGEIITCKRKFKQMNELHLKYVDDLTVVEAVDMKNQLDPFPIELRPQPDPYHSRTGHQLKPEKSRVYDQIIRTKEYATENKMKINLKKTKLMLFNPCRSRDFMPDFKLDGAELELVEETKLLGVIIRSDLSWVSNTEYMIKRANKKLWCLRRLKKLGADGEDLKDVYIKQIRSILEFAVPVWHGSITGDERLQLERVQKSALHIILGDQYVSYRLALKEMALETLFERRRKLCLKFAKKSAKSPKFSKWFKPTINKASARHPKPKYCEVFTRLRRYETSPISFLTKLLNRNQKPQ